MYSKTAQSHIATGDLERQTNLLRVFRGHWGLHWKVGDCQQSPHPCLHAPQREGVCRQYHCEGKGI